MEVTTENSYPPSGRGEAPLIHSPYSEKEQDNSKTKVKSADEKKQALYAGLDKIIEQYRREKGELIRILYGAQKLFGYLPREVQAYIAEKMDIPISEVNGVVTFYTLFVTEPKGRHTVSVCMGTACYVKGARDIMDSIKKELKLDAKESTDDGLFTLKSTRCIGACGMAPVVNVDEDIYGHLGAKDMSSILSKYSLDDSGVSDLTKANDSEKEGLIERQEHESDVSAAEKFAREYAGISAMQNKMPERNEGDHYNQVN